ncbi:Nuclear export mediator factor Nemf [Fulvia fulva]|nr:Nuclear export mediator factor Nemf [Fulvia fulva]KAK4614405.1 Nuclear export mediator factor Nemf [Fulvia fulva]WPV19845.1 Nuclear export mediator factor Nemf [Fulvia fulva]WPV35169.1 Nuclear export mediator factor Nemf [Fulvia fulva]
MKQRFSSLDVRVIAHELSNSLVSLRLANVYDLSSRIFLLKFAKPEHREQLIVDSGFRCHLTSFARATAAAPSPFVARLRKFLRTRRCTAVRQIGTDRIIELHFSDGAYRLFLEFYAGGNIVLTDAELTTLGLLRSVSEGAEHEQYRLGSKYDLSLRQNYEGTPSLTKERLRDGLQKAVERQQAEAHKPGRKIKKKVGDALRKALAITTTEFPPVLIDHALHVTAVDRQIEPEAVVGSDEDLDNVLKALQEANRIVQEITRLPVAKGYILAKRKVPKADEANGTVDDNQNVMYEDFHPFKPAQLEIDPANVFIEHEGFNKAVDDFFSSIEGQKLESRLHEREENAKRRIEQARQEQEKRITGLQQVQDLNVRKAQAIEANVERVEEAVAAVNGLIAQGMDWVDIGRLIENEQKRHNPVAELIKLPLKLHENTVTLLLSELADADDEHMDETDSEPSDSEDEDHQSKVKPASKPEDKRLTIDIDLAASGWSNARQYYDQRRTAATKQEKTAQASQKALKSTEQKVMADLKKGLKQEKEVLRPVRKQFWFEKFIYFISSDAYLVLAGKDAQQNEMLYRRYLRKGDVYVHADMHGAASVIIKNNPSTPEAPIPPSTLSQAGNLSVCTSSAWDSKAVMSAWWVNADQVSKTAPTGEYLTTGGFMVRGKKNFLPPAQLLLGFAIVFQISEESKARHVKHRLQQKPADYLATPDLTDGETIAESSAAGDGEESDDSDDEFPDAGPAPRIEEDDDDEFPDAAPRPDEFSADESPEYQRERTYGAYDDEVNEYRSGQSNPLQAGALQPAADENHDTEEGDDEHDDDDEDDDEAESPNGETATKENAATESTMTAGDEDGHTEADENAASAEVPLTNRERKMKNRLDQGKPIHNEAKVKQSKGQRGKKGKNKKIAQKYADQDEEDRELAMKLLGSKAGEEKRQAEAKVKAEKTETEEEEARARRRAQHQKAQREGLEAEEIRKLNLEEGVEILDEEESSQLTQLDALVGTPLPGDEILEAIAICAPWGALTRYKYKAKMQPGQQKKGKATREILGRWTKAASDPRAIDNQAQDNERIWPREAELIKNFKEVEVVGVIPVKQVRVMMSGGADAAKGKGGRGGLGGRGGKGSKRK